MSEPSAQNNKPVSFWEKYKTVILSVSITLFIVFIIFAAIAFGLLKYYVDGASIKRRAIDAPLRSVLWEKPRPLPGKLNGVRNNRDASISSDAKLIVLAHEYAEDNFDLYFSKKINDLWTKQNPIDEINSKYNEKGPEISNDGKFLFFSSDRPGGYGGYDLWYSYWENDHWSHPFNMGDKINTASNERDPSISPDSKHFFFSSDRPFSNDDANLDKKNDYDIYLALPGKIDSTKKKNQIIPKPPPFEKPHNMLNINSPYDEGKAVLTPRGNTIYLSSNRPGGTGGYDLYKSFFVEGHFLKPKNFGEPVNTPFDEINPTMSLEGFRIYFSSNRKSRNPNDFQVFKSTSREVLMKIDYNMLMKILLAFIAVILAVLLVYFLLKILLSDTRLGLLWKCLLAALLLHLLLLLLCGFWFFGSDLADKLIPAPKELTININNLARESIAMAIRESLSSLPNVKASAVAEKLPVPTKKPIATEVTQVSQQSNIPKTAETPVSMKPVPVQEAAKAPSGQVSLPELDPLEMGATNIKLETPPGESPGESTAAAGKNSDGDPKPLKIKHKTKKLTEEVIEYAKLKSLPIKVETNAVNDPVKNITTKNNTSPSELEKALAQSNRVADSPSSKNNNSSELELAMAPAPITGMQGLPGTFFLDADIKMEGRKKTDISKAKRIEMLTKDPNIAHALSIILKNDKVSRKELTDLVKDYIKKNQLPFNTSEVVGLLIKNGKLNSVGDIVYRSMNTFELPVDEELDMPEKYLKRLKH
jgi:hypothetical protein